MTAFVFSQAGKTRRGDMTVAGLASICDADSDMIGVFATCAC